MRTKLCLLLSSTGLMLETVPAQPPINYSVGEQLLMVSPRGKIIGASRGNFRDSVTPLFISSRRVVVMNDMQLIQYVPDGKGGLVQSILATASPAETVVPGKPANYDFKYVYTTTATQDGYVGTISRYLVTKLQVAP